MTNQEIIQSLQNGNANIKRGYEIFCEVLNDNRSFNDKRMDEALDLINAGTSELDFVEEKLEVGNE